MTAPPEFDAAFQEKLLELFAWRRDVRRFRPDALDAALAARLRAAADLAPSVGDSRPWRWIAADAAQRAAVRANFEAANAAALASYEGERARLYASLKLAGLERAPLQYAVFCDRGARRGEGLGRATMPQTLEFSVVGCITLYWLAARAAGVGVGWLSILDPEQARMAMGAPPDWSLVAYLCVGWPEEEHLDPELARAGWVGPR